ncbi:hypothetical protein HY489_02730 [Candidatus Woesearchaeota archaeon]|nr:hypothetical protein [Candidatus Woesearchaeota archaeon]
MKYRILLVAFFLGVLIGLSLFYQAPTGQAIKCTLNNQPCECNNLNCTCGDQTIPAEYCTQGLNKNEG